MVLAGISLFIYGTAQTVIKSEKKEGNYNCVSEIPNKDYLLDVGSKVLYKICNDNENLVVLLKVNEETTQKKILLFGLETWIDTKAKNRKEFGIKFPIENTGAEDMPGRKHIKGSFSQHKDILISQSTEMELFGFEGKKSSGIVSIFQKQGVGAEILNTYNDELIIQLKIPLSVLGIRDLSGNKVISLNIESGFLDLEQMRSSKPSGGVRPPKGGRGGSRSMHQNRQQMEALTIPFKLSIKKIELYK